MRTLVLVLVLGLVVTLCGCITSPLVDTRGMRVGPGDYELPADAGEREKMLYNENQGLKRKIDDLKDENKKLKQENDRLKKDMKKARGD